MILWIYSYIYIYNHRNVIHRSILLRVETDALGFLFWKLTQDTKTYSGDVSQSPIVWLLEMRLATKLTIYWAKQKPKINNILAFQTYNGEVAQYELKIKITK